MIRFYADSFRTLGGWGWRARIWAHQHPVIARISLAMALAGYFTLSSAHAAYAAGFLPDGIDYIDIEPGGVLTPGFVIVNFVVQLSWATQYFFTGVVIWLFDFLLGFEWIAWLSTPFNTLAVWIQEQLGTINFIPFALVVSAAVGGIAIFVGRVAGGLWEMLVAAIIAVLAVGALANPVATLTTADGALSQAQQFGGQLATSIVIDESQAGQSQATMSTAVTSQLMDIFVRVPHQVISYGQVLPEACQGAYNTFIQSGEPQASLRSCAPEAAVFAHDNPGGLNIVNAGVNEAGVFVLFLFGMVLATLLIVSVFAFLVAAVKSMLLVYLCILPVDRQPLWRSVSDSFMGLVSLVVMTVLLSLYLKLTTWIMGETGGLPHQLRMVLLVIILIIIIYLVIRARRKTIRAGRDVAGHLSKLGLGMKPGQKDSNALLKMSAVTSMAKTGYDLLHRGPGKLPAPAAAGGGSPTIPAAPSRHYQATPMRTGRRPQAPQAALAASTSAAPSQAAYAAGAARTAQTAQKAVGAGSAVVTVAKGATAGGAGGAAVAGAAVLVKGTTRKAIGAGGAKAVLAGTRNTATGAKRKAIGSGVAKALPTGAGGAATGAADQRTITVIEAPRRIAVDSKGVASAVSRPPVVYDVSSLPPRQPAPRSAKALERRRQLDEHVPTGADESASKETGP